MVATAGGMTSADASMTVMAALVVGAYVSAADMADYFPKRWFYGKIAHPDGYTRPIMQL
jgi:hypothetical protein